MYCKNCGKSLPDDARFCDKCNMSVRKEKGKMDMIEELREERLARQKAYEIEERLKKIRKVKIKRYNSKMLIVLGIIAIWGVIAGAFYYINIKDSKLKDAEPELMSTQAPTATQTATTEPVNDDYTTVTLDGIEITYPIAFDQSEVQEGDCVASFSDGTAKIIINREVAIMTPRELLDEYYKGILNGKIADGDSKVSDDGYTVTASSGTRKHHKKAVIKDGEVFSYELIYPMDEASTYEEYTKYMDELFKTS